MRVSIITSEGRMSFGKGAILERISADPLVYGDAFPGVTREDLIPEVRRIRLEGYLRPTGDTAAERLREMELRRRWFASATAPGAVFSVDVDGKIADCTGGELTFDRSAPFNGEAAERFVLRAVIKGGFFRSEPIEAVPEPVSEGTVFPLSAESGVVVGIEGGASVIRIQNGGDVPAGFTAQFTPAAAVTSFKVTDRLTGKFISCSNSFGSGDVIEISTHRNCLGFTVTREDGTVVNLTGYADEGSELFLLPVGETELVFDGDVGFTGTVSFCETFVTF